MQTGLKPSGKKGRSLWGISFLRTGVSRGTQPVFAYLRAVADFGDYIREAASCAIGCVGHAKILENLQKPLLLIKKANVVLRPIDLAEKSPTDNRQAAIAKLRADTFVGIPIALV
jgi:hypothetical protein